MMEQSKGTGARKCDLPKAPVRAWRKYIVAGVGGSLKRKASSLWCAQRPCYMDGRDSDEARRRTEDIGAHAIVWSTPLDQITRFSRLLNGMCTLCPISLRRSHPLCSRVVFSSDFYRPPLPPTTSAYDSYLIYTVDLYPRLGTPTPASCALAFGKANFCSPNTNHSDALCLVCCQPS
jgi:hypothetical protein